MDDMSDTTLDDSDYPHQSNQRQSDDSDKEIVISVYKDVWFEFYSWEPGHCQQVISSLAVEAYSFPLVPNLSVEISSIALDLRESVNIVADFFQSYPNYEFCTPASRSISYPQDSSEPNDAAELPFIPYADNPAFEIIEWSTKFPDIVWQLDLHSRDPDEEVIQLETVRRLHLGYDLSFSEIDRLKLLRKIRCNNESGLLWDNSQRDVLNWPGAQLSSFDQLLLNTPSMEYDLWGRMNQMLSFFCPNLNCVQPFCPVHTYRHPNFDSLKPTVTSTSMLQTEGELCGNNCFRREDIRSQGTTNWNTIDTEILSSVLKITPDLSPCELAVLCWKPCWEVYLQRSNLIPDDVIRNEEPLEQGKSRHGTKLKFADNDHTKYTPLSPCSHKGPCSTHTGCSCFKNRLHCGRNCRCSLDCKRRWGGCRCKTSACQDSKRCKCRKANRECDPDVCKSCDAKYRSKKRCGNVEVQRGLAPIIEIKEGKVGLGAFATCDYGVNDFVGDYVGLSNTREDTQKLAIDYIQPKLPNYFFDLNKAQLLDAAKAGNETRYLNHAYLPDNNCASKVLVVNDEHRICLYATKKIAKGEELLLDYGESYWNDEEPVQ